MCVISRRVCGGLLALLPLVAFAGWDWLNPWPTGNGLNGVHLLDENVGIIVGDAGTVIASFDGGRTLMVQQPVRADLRGVWCVSATAAFAVGDGGRILRSLDSARTWRTLPSGISTTLRAVCFPDGPEVGYVCGDGGVVLKTTDGGNGWGSLPVGTADDLLCLQFISEQVGYAAGVRGQVFRTDDGGTVWTPLLVDPPVSLRGMSFIDADNGFIAGDSSCVFRTTDGGAQWRPSRVESDWSVTLNAVSFLYDVRTGVAVGSNLQVYRTSDAGRTWATIPDLEVPGRVFGISLAPSGAMGWLVTEGGGIARSNDAGRTWQLQSRRSLNAVNDLEFPVDPLNGYAAGYGVVAKTADAGYTWNEISVGNNVALNALCFPRDAAIGYAAGDSGCIFKTTDAGATWHAQSCPAVHDDFHSVSFPAQPETGWASTLSGQIVGTTNGGTDWVRMPDPGRSPLHSVYFLNGRMGFAGCHDTAIFRTEDGGVTWQSYPTVFLGFRKFSFPNRGDIGYVCGDAGNILKTTDRGRSWEWQNTDTTVWLRDISFPTGPDTGFACGDRAVVLGTCDGGATWTCLPVLVNYESFYSVAFGGNNRVGCLSAGRALLLGTRDAGGLGVTESRGATMPVTLLRIVPNPARGRVRVSCELPGPARLRLALYDRVGRSCAVVPVGLVQAGAFERVLDVAGLSRGVYFLRLEGSGRALSGRLMIE